MKNKERIKRLETLVDTLISMQIELDLVHQVRERLEPALGQMDLSGIVAKPTDSLKMEEVNEGGVKHRFYHAEYLSKAVDSSGKYLIEKEKPQKI